MVGARAVVRRGARRRQTSPLVRQRARAAQGPPRHRVAAMPMLCLAGTFRILSTEPDGDSIRFYPDDPAAWARVPGPTRCAPTRAAARSCASTASTRSRRTTRPAAAGRCTSPSTSPTRRATSSLRWLGFRGHRAHRRDGHRRDARGAAGLPAHARRRRLRPLRGADRARRPARRRAGRRRWSGSPTLRRTANHRLIATGLAYPTFYLKLYADLRAELAKQSRQARDAKKGVWAGDRTQKGVDVAEPRHADRRRGAPAQALPPPRRLPRDQRPRRLARRVPRLPRAAPGPRLHPLDRHLHRLRLRGQRPRPGRASSRPSPRTSSSRRRERLSRRCAPGPRRRRACAGGPGRGCRSRTPWRSPCRDRVCPVPVRQCHGAGASPVANFLAAATAFAHDTPRSA